MVVTKILINLPHFFYHFKKYFLKRYLQYFSYKLYMLKKIEFTLKVSLKKTLSIIL